MSNRKIALKLLKNNNENSFYMGRCEISGHIRYNINSKYTYGPHCWVCKKYEYNNVYNIEEIQINNIKIKFCLCTNCKYKKLCFGCLRETSHCRQIHTRKLLCYKILLSHKFPKDIIRLIAKKVK